MGIKEEVLEANRSYASDFGDGRLEEIREATEAGRSRSS